MHSNFFRGNKEAQVISRQLRPRKVVAAKTGQHGDLIALYFPLNEKDSTLVVERRSTGFLVSEQALRLETQTVVKSGEILSSLFGATDTAGIPDAIATQLAEIFAADIDFNRDLRKGDRFSLVYETPTHRGQTVRSSRILSAELINDRKRSINHAPASKRNGADQAKFNRPRLVATARVARNRPPFLPRAML